MYSQESSGVVLRVPCSDRSGEHNYIAELLWEGGKGYGLTPRRIADIWREARKFDVLFSDETKGKFEPFFFSLVNPGAVWFELRREGDDTPVGILYYTNLIPGFDTQGHFAFWDSIARGREPLILFVTEWVMDRYNLPRITAQIPPYQAGVIRFTKRVGFVQEGEMREAVIYKDRRWPLLIFGMTRGDLDGAFRSLY